MSRKSWLIILVAISPLFQNCSRAFQQIDAAEKSRILSQDSVFGGKASYIYIKKSGHLKSAEQGGQYVNDTATEGAIPVTGPNGETVVPVVTNNVPGAEMPAIGQIPAGAQVVTTNISTQGSVLVGPNWHVPPPTTTSSGGDTDWSWLALVGAMVGAVVTTMSTSSYTESPTYSYYNPSSYSSPSSYNTEMISASSGSGGCVGYGCGTGAGTDANPIWVSGSNCPPADGGVGVTYACSPLLINMDEAMDSRHLELTNPDSEGILFDIAGNRSWPSPHTPKRISWHRNINYMFIVKPNDKGEVHGINEMFGDSTMGPDGKFSDNGYTALAKWDGRELDGKRFANEPDRLITAGDPVYATLRLWSDKNFDGNATRDELVTLTEAGIEVIDLRYDGNYIEMDQYGNYTAFKSVARDFSGKMHMVFDLWFRVKK